MAGRHFRLLLKRERCAPTLAREVASTRGLSRQLAKRLEQFPFRPALRPADLGQSQPLLALPGQHVGKELNSGAVAETCRSGRCIRAR